ncbi:hypothetical protein, conserved [Trypanosoma cruzi]|uniref:Transmembrane protein n=2 Tax=Trypanosoma cruzi TaxID=5693 RepID=Q4DUM9_TRYCC|nr:hypothetical protein, conserved [Trypanosoma cruzi]EAN96229.1 hypothetical protein, conserved [Trypanosoma cruzi]|eukprot:XP_818080.1 hypothetical protein [Trypanosoma cruzi strain CL Brener]
MPILCITPFSLFILFSLLIAFGVMVYFLARDVALCLLLDQYGDPTVVRKFVEESWRALQESQPPSQLQYALWLCHRVAKEVQADGATTLSTCHLNSDDSHHGKGDDEGRLASMALRIQAGTPLSNAVERLTVQNVIQWLKSMPPSPSSLPRFGGSNNEEKHTDGGVVMRCETVEQLWVSKCLLRLVRRAVGMQLRHVLPPSKSTDVRPGEKHHGCANNNNKSTEEEDIFRHDFAVLVPVHVCRCIQGLSLRQIVALCSVQIAAVPRSDNNTTTTTTTSSSSSSGDEKKNFSRSSASSLGLIINPAVSPSDNPHRKEKNRRIENIQHAMMSQHYQDMVRTGSRSGSTHGSALQQEKQRESFASFLRDASIGFDMQIMALSGGAAGYYLAHMRGLPAQVCIVCGAIGLLFMLLVDAVLFTLRIGRMDAQTRKEKSRRWKQLRKQHNGCTQRREESEKLTGDGGDDVDTVTREKKNN